MGGHPLALTGERTLPGVDSENYWFRRHEIAYEACAAAAFRDGWDSVLDAGCGEGYGADRLADAAARVIALDVDPATIAHARRAYPRLIAAHANLVALPLATGSCDAAVSLQVIEHQWDIAAYLDELARVLGPGGALWCATPNRLTFADDAGGRRAHPCHTMEFAAAELVEVLSTRFTVEAVGGVWAGSRLAAAEAECGAAMPRLLADAGDPATWPVWLTALVAGVTAQDFTVAWPEALADLDDSLDLLAVCRA